MHFLTFLDRHSMAVSRFHPGHFVTVFGEVTIYMAAETKFLYIESETVHKHENITIGSFNMELLPCNFLIEIECFYEIKE